ncbi:polysaccharide pyruvyl transferase family protein [Clostridium tagluense]|uniref:polysaccharide pyruvyl transferase family protein n=1 Tax=Clostridium tagluense TaxID=360422 RepID=UPI001C6F5DA1|nr:polysaccharide pyruvyl transferase family protein [Clostridium tagluense]MBW9155671.1 polysaccharide pyruvyl transferase family protein [Clostridium tagluense]WLC65274.1 polysaccharide pyruvyl transferase family protein [Clostridium tagluense]
MKIYIKHIWNTFNYGSCMMAITLINKINQNYDNVIFYVDVNSDIDLERLKSEVAGANIKRSRIDATDNLLKKCINKIRRIKLNKIIENIENIIIIGGDDISEYYGIDRLESELYKLKEESQRKNIYLIGHTMGPFTGNRGELARQCLSETKIHTRDDKNLNYLKSLNFKNAKSGRDLAFIELPMQYQYDNKVSEYNLEENKYITLVPSGLVESYTNNFDDYIRNWVNIIKKLWVSDKFEKIVLLMHVSEPDTLESDNDDRRAINKIMEKLDKKTLGKIVAITDAMLPSEAREILGNGLFTITGRMHSGVSTFYMRKPAISLSYSVKYSGVIGDGLDMNELVIESADEKLWKCDEISKLVNEKVDFILKNYDSLVKKIDTKVSETSKIVESELEELVSEIRKSNK